MNFRPWNLKRSHTRLLGATCERCNECFSTVKKNRAEKGWSLHLSLKAKRQKNEDNTEWIRPWAYFYENPYVAWHLYSEKIIRYYFMLYQAKQLCCSCSVDHMVKILTNTCWAFDSTQKEDQSCLKHLRSIWERHDCFYNTYVMWWGWLKKMCCFKLFIYFFDQSFFFLGSLVLWLHPQWCFFFFLFP